MMNLKYILPVSTLTLALALSGVVSAEECPRVEPNILPQSSYSGAWLGEVLTLVDTGSDQLLRYARDGRALKPMKAGVSTGGGSESLPPSAIVSQDGRAVLQTWRGGFLIMDQALRPQSDGLKRLIRDGDDGAESAGLDVRGVYSWDVGGDSLVFCGDVKAGSNWDSGFMRAPLSDLGAAVMLDKSWSLMDPELIYCRIGYDYIATLGDDTFIVYDDGDGNGTRIHRFEGSEVKGPLTTDIGQRPELPQYENSRDFADMMLLIEGSTMPAGLYAWEGDLYVLNRAPAVDGRTSWSLTRVDPSSGEILGSGGLPSTANHLTVVPGKQQWAVLEKGSVLGFEDQESYGLRMIPAKAIRGISEKAADRLICE